MPTKKTSKKPAAKKAEKTKTPKAATKVDVKAAQKNDALTRAVAKRDLTTVASLLAAGVDPDARPADAKNAHDTPSALLEAVRGKYAEKARHALVQQLLDAGARVDYVFPDLRIIDKAWIAGCVSAIDVAAAIGDLKLVKQLMPLAKDKTLLPSALVVLLRNSFDSAHRLPDPELDADKLRALVATGLPVTGASRCGLTAAHAVALTGQVELLEVLLAADPELPARKLPGARTLDLSNGDKITLGKGATPAGVAAAYRDGVRRHREKFSGPGYQNHVRWDAEKTARLDQVITRLEAAGGKTSTGTITLAKPLRPLYDALCAWLGKSAVDEGVANIKTDTTPYLFMRNIADQLPGLVPKLAPIADRNVLAFILDPKNYTAVVHVSEQDELSEGAVVIDPEEFAKKGRRVLDRARLITMRGDAVVMVNGLNGGNIWEVGAEEAIDHGSVGKLMGELRAELG